MEATHPYHHGNLKRALIEAAVTLISEVGPRGFTLREVARRARVSHNAPYRHFQDKEELLDAVAIQGFQRLRRAMRQSARSGSAPQHQLQLCGRGYVRFALRWPQHFQVMFDLPSDKKERGAHAAAGEETFATLLKLIVENQKAGTLPEGDSQKIAFVIWSMVHGVAKLAVSRHLPFSAAELFDFTDLVSSVVVAGLNHRKPILERTQEPNRPGAPNGEFLGPRRHR